MQLCAYIRQLAHYNKQTTFMCVITLKSEMAAGLKDALLAPSMEEVVVFVKDAVWHKVSCNFQPMPAASSSTMISDFELMLFVFCRSACSQKVELKDIVNNFFPASSCEYLKRHKQYNPFTLRHSVFTVPYCEDKVKDEMGNNRNNSQKSIAIGEILVIKVFFDFFLSVTADC